jgi:hypothetical protein
MEENVTIEYKNEHLVTTMHYPQKELVLQVGGVSYTVGFDGPNNITQTVTKDNIPLLLDYLKEQFGLMNGQYEEAKKQLAELEGLDDKVVAALENHFGAIRTAASNKDVEILLKKFPVYAEFADKCLKKVQLKKRVTDIEPAVSKLKKQIDTVITVMNSIK